MKIIKEGKLNKLIADLNYLLKEKDDNYKPAYIDEEGNKVEEYFPCVFEYAYLPDSITLEIAKTMYDELIASDYPWKTIEEPQEETMDTIWEEALLDGFK